MRTFYFLQFLFFFVFLNHAQDDYFQQKVNTYIEVSLNDEKHELSGFEKIDYTNNSPQSLDSIVIHLWPNAYKNNSTEMAKHDLENGELEFRFSESKNKGYIDSLNFSSNEKPLRWSYLNNKIDLAQAESVADLIAAQTQEAALAAHASLTGGFSSNINSCIDALVASRAYIEASLDFPEEDLEQKDLDRIEVEIKEQLDFIQSTIASSKKGVLAREGFCVAIVGAPNAGKSTLLNALAQKDLAITSSVAGTTRDTIRASLNLGGVVSEFVDTAGLRDFPENAIEAEGIKKRVPPFKKLTLCCMLQMQQNRK